MWKSPIEIIKEKVQTQLEKDVMTAVQKCGIVVDKKELIKALKYDREQYNKGYADGFANAGKEVAIELCAAMDEVIDLICKMAGFGIEIFGKYAELKKRYIGGDEE